jgi:hypothetical protein
MRGRHYLSENVFNARPRRGDRQCAMRPITHGTVAAASVETREAAEGEDEGIQASLRPVGAFPQDGRMTVRGRSKVTSTPTPAAPNVGLPFFSIAHPTTAVFNSTNSVGLGPSIGAPTAPVIAPRESPSSASSPALNRHGAMKAGIRFFRLTPTRATSAYASPGIFATSFWNSIFPKAKRSIRTVLFSYTSSQESRSMPVMRPFSRQRMMTRPRTKKLPNTSSGNSMTRLVQGPIWSEPLRGV